jgi:hypothetical protein
VLLGVMAVVSALPLAPRLGSEFMPPLDEGDMLYMPTTLPGISIEEARRQLQRQDAMLREFPEVESVLGKAAAPRARPTRRRCRCSRPSCSSSPGAVAHPLRAALVRGTGAGVWRPLLTASGPSLCR